MALPILSRLRLPRGWKLPAALPRRRKPPQGSRRVLLLEPQAQALLATQAELLREAFRVTGCDVLPAAPAAPDGQPAALRWIFARELTDLPVHLVLDEGQASEIAEALAARPDLRPGLRLPRGAARVAALPAGAPSPLLVLEGPRAAPLLFTAQSGALSPPRPIALPQDPPPDALVLALGAAVAEAAHGAGAAAALFISPALGLDEAQSALVAGLIPLLPWDGELRSAVEHLPANDGIRPTLATLGALRHLAVGRGLETATLATPAPRRRPRRVVLAAGALLLALAAAPLVIDGEPRQRATKPGEPAAASALEASVEPATPAAGRDGRAATSAPSTPAASAAAAGAGRVPMSLAVAQACARAGDALVFHELVATREGGLDLTGRVVGARGAAAMDALRVAVEALAGLPFLAPVQPHLEWRGPDAAEAELSFRLLAAWAEDAP